VRTGSVVLPDNVSFDEACVTEPVSCILRGFQAADMKLGDTVLIIGSGFIGLVALQMARLLGAGLVGVSDIADAKLGPAAGYGADFTVNSREQDILEILTEKNQGRKADIVFNSAPAIQAVSQALDLVERGGTIVQFGGTSPEETVPINPYVFITREITFLGTYSSSPAEARSTVDLVAHGKLDVKSLITDHYPLDRIGEAFRNKRSSGDSLKVVIHPNTT
jgi:L-iditol 2-dehydrogenase